MDAVASVQLSATTMMRFGAGSWATERVERRADGGRLVVGGDEDGDRHRAAEHAAGLGHHELGREQLHLGVGRAPGSVHDDPFDERHARGEQQRETDGTDHDGEGGRLGVVEDVPDAEQRSSTCGDCSTDCERADTANHSRSAPPTAMPAMTRPT